MKWVLIFRGEEEIFDTLLWRRMQELKSWRFWAWRSALFYKSVFLTLEWFFVSVIEA